MNPIRKIRRSVFETNSSSSHSIVIDLAPTSCDCPCCTRHLPDLDTLPVDRNGVCKVHAQLEIDASQPLDTKSKAALCLYHAKFKNNNLLLVMLHKVIKETTNAKRVELIPVPYKPDLYEEDKWGSLLNFDCGIDGNGIVDAFKSQETLKSFIFDRKSKVHTVSDGMGD